MGLPSGIFSAPIDGRLRVTFQGNWRADGADWVSAEFDIFLIGYVGEGAARRTAALCIDNNTAWIEFDYVANENVPVGMEYKSHSLPAGGHEVEATELRISCELLRPATAAPGLTFAELLARLNNVVGPMAATPQTPRWEPDVPSGVSWYVRPLSSMATNQVVRDFRYYDIDTSAPDYDPGDSTTWTGFFNHPLAPPGVGGIRVRDANPIDPASVIVIGHPNLGWAPPSVAMETEVRLDTTSTPGTPLYYIHATRGPLSQNIFQGTAEIWYNYADLAVLDGTTYETAWPGLNAIDWALIQPGDTLWVCGTYDDETLNVQASGAPGAYVRIRLDYLPDPGRINQARIIKTPWTYDAITGEYNTPLFNVTDCALYENETRLVGVNTRSRTRLQVQHANVDYAADTLFFGSIRRIQTGMEIIIGSDFDTRNLVPGLTPDTRYYAIVVSSNWEFYSVANAQYTIKLAASYADALAGVAVDILPFTAPDDFPNTFFLVWVRQFDYPFFDQLPGELDSGQYCVDPVARLLYYKPTGGVVGDHTLRISSESFSAIGACIYGVGRSYIKIFGGGEYGGLFPDLPAPVGRVGLAHQNIIEFTGGSDIVVDGLLVDGGRSGVTWIGTLRGTVRNCRIKNIAHHASGGEDLATTEPQQLIERNWISDIGLGHDFGDAQALVTNPGCDGTVYRRNFCQRLGRNTKVTNPAAAVYDSSDDVITFRNWFDDSHGHLVELGAGAVAGEEAFGGCRRPVVACNVITRTGRGYDPATNLIQRVGAFHVTLNGTLDFGVWDVDIFGNLLAFSVIGDRAPDTLDPCGLVYMRTNNNTTGQCEIRVFQRNAILNVNGPVFSLQRNTSSTVTPLLLSSDYNLYAATPEFAQLVLADTVARTVDLTDVWDGGHIKGVAAGYWSADTSHDTHSALAVQAPTDLPVEPTIAQLEYIRRWDDYDTLDRPSIAAVGSFPFA